MTFWLVFCGQACETGVVDAVGDAVDAFDPMDKFRDDALVVGCVVAPACRSDGDEFTDW